MGYTKLLVDAVLHQPPNRSVTLQEAGYGPMRRWTVKASHVRLVKLRHPRLHPTTPAASSTMLGGPYILRLLRLPKQTRCMSI